MNLLDKLLRSVSERFPGDQTKPGLVLSELQYGVTYASICRYEHGPHAKTIVVKVKVLGNSDEALRALALAWISHCDQTPSLRCALNLSARVFDNALKAAL